MSRITSFIGSTAAPRSEGGASLPPSAAGTGAAAAAAAAAAAGAAGASQEAEEASSMEAATAAAPAAIRADDDEPWAPRSCCAVAAAARKRRCCWCWCWCWCWGMIVCSKTAGAADAAGLRRLSRSCCSRRDEEAWRIIFAIESAPVSIDWGGRGGFRCVRMACAGSIILDDRRGAVSNASSLSPRPPAPKPSPPLLPTPS
jgi:hypothetical protein